MPESRSGAIDVAKGCAILGVILIHSELFVPGVFQTHVINRAVPMFFVLFGVTSTLWWDKTSSRGRIAAWYRSRFVRLLPAYWLAVALWWLGQRLFSSHPLATQQLWISLAGYAPWIQTSWFVTAILQIILLFPLLRLAVDKLGALVVLALSLAALVVLQVELLPVNAWLHEHLPYPEVTLGFYPFWVFVPHYFWLVVCGMSMAGIARAPSFAVVLAALVLFVAAGLIEPLVVQPSTFYRILSTVVDPVRTVLLLAAAVVLVRFGIVAELLTWLGRNSWEIYVGQMAVHSLAHRAWERVGGPLEHRLEYTMLLLVGGCGFALALGAIRDRR